MIIPSGIEIAPNPNYIELGTSGLFVQLAIASGIGVLIYFRVYLKKAKALLSNLLKELIDFYRFFCRIPKAEKAITFYSEHRDYYPYFEGLITELTTLHNQSICYITSDSCDPILQSQESGVKPFYLNKLLPLFMAFVNCQVFVMTLTDLNQFHFRRSIKPVHYVYVFHSLVSTHMMYRHGAFDYYDSILCCNSHQIKEIRKHEKANNLPPKTLIKAGYSRLEKLYTEYQEFSPEKPKVSSKGTILIAPSWGEDNILESCGGYLIELLLNASYGVIVRSHPETTKRFPDLLVSLISKFGHDSNFSLETSTVTHNSLLKADVMICDCSGVALEYAFGTERPVLFIDTPVKIKNQRYKELGIRPLELSLRSKIGVLISPKKIDTVPQVISELIANKVDYKKHIVELRKKNVYAFGHSSDIGASYIANLVEKSNE